LFDLNSLDHSHLKGREIAYIYTYTHIYTYTYICKRKIHIYIYAKIISIHYTHTYRFIQTQLHRQKNCTVGRIVYSFWKPLGFTVSRPIWLHCYGDGRSTMNFNFNALKWIEFTLNVNCTVDNIAFNVSFLFFLWDITWLNNLSKGTHFPVSTSPLITL